VSLIGFIIATRAPVRLLEDTFPVPSLQYGVPRTQIQKYKMHKPS
jgi:hypothetical protein